MNSFLSTFIHGILSFIMYITNFLLAPLNALISEYLPNLNYAFQQVSAFFTYIGNLVPWAISYLGLSNEILQLVLAFLLFKISLPILSISIKTAIKWYRAIKT